MTDFLLGVQGMFDNTWRLLCGINLPGTSISFAAVFIGFFLVAFGIFLFRRYSA